jgi:hypothetical protein
MTRKCHVRFGGGRLEKDESYLASRLPYTPAGYSARHQESCSGHRGGVPGFGQLLAGAGG